MAIRFLSSENVEGHIDVNYSQNGITYLAVTNTNSGAAANARIQAVGESSQLDIIASSAGYTGVTGWADSGIISTDSGASGGLKLNAQAGGLSFQIGTSTAMFVDTNSKVGIGTASPTSKLSISGSQTAIDLTRGTAGDSKWGLSSDSTALYIAELSTGSTDYIMTLKETTGYVGIGTNSPSELLTVNGNIQLGNGGGGGYLKYNTGNLYIQGTSNIVATFESAGNVGIGTTTPDELLHINKAVSAGSDNLLLRIQNPTTATDARVGIAFSVNDHTGTNWDGAYIQAENDGIAQADLTFGSAVNNSLSQHMIIEGNTGNVGIGTTSPDYTLHLLKSSGDTEMYINGQNGQSSLRMGLDLRNWQIKTAAAPYLWSLNYVGTDAALSNIITANVGGNVGIGTASPQDKVQVHGGDIKITHATGGTFRGLILGATEADANDYSSLMWQASSGELRLSANPASFGGFMSFYSNASEAMRITSSGNVGIGTSAPQELLHLYKTGDIKQEIESLNENAYLIINSGADGVGDSNREEGFIKFYQANNDFWSLGKRNNGYFSLYDHTAAKYVMQFGDNGAFELTPANNITTITGSVGIGTTLPSNKLHIAETTNVDAILSLNANSSALGISYMWNLVGASSSSNYSFQIREASTTYLSIRNSAGGSAGALQLNSYGSGTFTGTATYKLSVDASGNVIETAIGAGAVDGSGTAGTITKWTDSDTIGDSPITISGSDATFAGTVTGGNGTFSNLTISATEKLRFDGAGGHTYITESANDNLQFATGGSLALTLDSSQDATFVGNIQGNGGIKIVGPGSHNTIQSTNEYTLGFKDSNGTTQHWLKNYTNGNFAIHENGVGDTLTIAAGGNVGIGTTSPTAQLDVGGSSTNNIGMAIFTESSTTAYLTTSFNSRPTYTLYGINTANTYVGTRLSHAGNTEFFQGIVKGANNGEMEYVWQGYNGTAYQQFGYIDCYGTGAGSLHMAGGATFTGDVGIKKAGANALLYLQNTASVTSGNRADIAFYNSDTSTVANIRATAVTDNVGTSLNFFTRPVGGALTESMTLDANGWAYIRNNNTGYGLEIVGTGGGYLDIAQGSTVNSFTSNNVFSFNQNVGIGTTGPTATLQVTGDIKIGSGAGSGTDSNNMSIQVSNATYGDTANLGLLVRNNGTNGEFAQIGFGYSESKCPVVIGSVTTSGSSATKGDFIIGTRSTTTGSDAPVERMRITSAGNVGIGVTPSNAFVDSRAIEIGANGTIWSEQASSIYNSIISGIGFYYNAAGATIYKTTSLQISRYVQYQGEHLFQYAAAGTAGGAITWSEAFRTSDTGNVVIGTTAINGSFGASNTILAVKGKTSGGEGIIQITGLGNNNGDNVGALMFYSQAETDAMCSIRSIRGTGDDVGTMTFLTNNGGTESERMRINSSGNVGIGTAVENDINEAKLYVNGTLGLDANSEIKYGKNAGGPYLNIRSKDSSTSACGIRIHSPSGSPGYLYGEGSSGSNAYIGILDADGAWGYQIRTDTSHTWLINNSNQMHLTTTGLGIGTTSPSSKIDVRENANNVYTGYFYNSSTAENAHGINVQTATTNAGAYAFRVNSGSDSNALVVKGNANVGIGVEAPTANLHVVGDASQGTVTIEAPGSGGAHLRLWDNTSSSSPYIEMGEGSGGSFTRKGFIQMSGNNIKYVTENVGSGAHAFWTTPTTAGTRVKQFQINSSGSAAFTGAVSKASGSFRIDHPLEAKKDTHQLVHSFVEGPQADNIYRGKIDLVDGKATVNIDTEAGMTDGTFVVLNTNIQCFTTNESNWDLVKGSVSENVLTIESKNTSSNATISWLVIGERHDQHMKDTDWTDDDGKVIVEPLKPEDTDEPAFNI